MLNLMIHVKAFFTTACLSPNIIIQISRMRILTFSQVYIPGGKQMSYFTQFCARFVRVI